MAFLCAFAKIYPSVFLWIQNSFYVFYNVFFLHFDFNRGLFGPDRLGSSKSKERKKSSVSRRLSESGRRQSYTSRTSAARKGRKTGRIFSERFRTRFQSRIQIFLRVRLYSTPCQVSGKLYGRMVSFYLYLFADHRL